MGRTSSTTHRRHFCRALHLQPSDKKLGCEANECLCHICTTLTLNWVMGLIVVVIREFREFKEFRVGRCTMLSIILKLSKFPNLLNFLILPNFVNYRKLLA